MNFDCLSDLPEKDHQSCPSQLGIPSQPNQSCSGKGRIFVRSLEKGEEEDSINVSKADQPYDGRYKSVEAVLFLEKGSGKMCHQKCIFLFFSLGI